MQQETHRQGEPFEGDYFWENAVGDEAPKEGRFESILESRYDAKGITTVHIDGEDWFRVPIP